MVARGRLKALGAGVVGLLALALVLCGQAAANWSAPQAVSDPGMTADPTELRVAASRLGHAGAAWRGATGSMSTAAAFSAPGGAFGAPQLLSGANATNSPVISIGANGAAIVAWEDDPDGSSDAIAARVRSSGSAALGGIDFLQGPEDSASSNIGDPDVDVFSSAVSGQLGVAAFTHYWTCFTFCYWHVGTSNIAGPGSFSTAGSVIGNGGWNSIDVETQTDGSAIAVAKSDLCCNQRTIVPAGRGANGTWARGDALAYGDGNNPGCLCGSVPRIARLPDSSAAIVYTRNSSPGDNIQFSEFSLVRAMGRSEPALPTLTETTLNSSGETGNHPLVVSDAAGDLLVGWMGSDGRVLTRYRPVGGAFQATQVAGTEALGLARNFGLAMGADGDAYVAYIADGAVRVAVRPAGAGSSWAASEPVSGTTTSPDGLSLAAGAGRAFVGFVARGADTMKRVYTSAYAPPSSISEPPPSGETGSSATGDTGGSTSGEGDKTVRRHKPTYGQCVRRARKVFRRALRKAKRKRGKARAKAVKAAKRRRAKLVRRCRARFHKGKRKRKSARHR